MCMHTCACAPRSLACVGEGNALRLIILVIATVILIVIMVAVVTKAATISWHSALPALWDPCQGEQAVVKSQVSGAGGLVWNPSSATVGLWERHLASARFHVLICKMGSEPQPPGAPMRLQWDPR